MTGQKVVLRIYPQYQLPSEFNISCNQCFCFSAKEEKLDILTIPLSRNINCSLSKFLKPEILESENKWFCPSCNCLTESTRETSIIGSSSILVIQLSRFSTSHSRLLKDPRVFNCSPELELKVPITVEDEVSFSSKTLLRHQLIIQVRWTRGITGL